jgi:hypothetical protein
MAHRYRLTPASDQEVVLREHCAHARFVWNLAFELSQWGTLETYGEATRRERADGTGYARQKRRPVRPRPGLAAQCRMLTEARAEYEWLREGRPGRPDPAESGGVRRRGRLRRSPLHLAAVPRVRPHREGEPRQPSGLHLPQVRPPRPRRHERSEEHTRPGNRRTGTPRARPRAEGTTPAQDQATGSGNHPERGMNRQPGTPGPQAEEDVKGGIRTRTKTAPPPRPPPVPGAGGRDGSAPAIPPPRTCRSRSP